MTPSPLPLLSEVIAYLDREIPRTLQESYDNSGCQVMPPDVPLTGVLLAVDVTEEVVLEAVERGCNLVVSHHPLLFKGVKQVGQRTYIERALGIAIRHDLAIYSAHTSLDNLYGGVNHYWSKRMGLLHCHTLQPLEAPMMKVITYVPCSAAAAMYAALREVGAGKQGVYEGCSFATAGTGRFVPGQGASPYVGELGQWHAEPEEMIATMCRSHELPAVERAIRAAHPYEEPVIDAFPLTYRDSDFGAGIIGELPEPMEVRHFLDLLKERMELTTIAHSRLLKEQVQRIAFCGGSGAFLRPVAARLGADLFITGEAKYNDYYDATDDVTLVTIGHYESEAWTKALLYDILCRKIPNFVLQYAERCANPVCYHC